VDACLYEHPERTVCGYMMNTTNKIKLKCRAMIYDKPLLIMTHTAVSTTTDVKKKQTWHKIILQKVSFF
jgi:hypothetical protein